MFWCEKENRWCSVWSCDRKECEFVVRASDKERFYQCLISGYESDLYNEYLRKWHKTTFNSCAEHGKKRIEVVWMNYQKGQMTLKDYVTRGQL